MSLNGLDAPSVKEAYGAAVAEAGGWFLLKYSSRDEVELLGRGTGGIVEIRNKISQYDENSPLYGFLRYRRRNVIIKFQPEECSRLLQARATVHFNVVCDHFSPYDTTFTIADAKELKDTKLSAACSLHAASGSTSSSTSSLRRRRLMEITEEEEEEERERKRQSVVKEEGGQDDTPRSPTVLSTEPPVRLNADLANSPDASHFSKTTEPPSFTGAPRAPSPTKSLDDGPRRMSSQSSRPDMYSSHSYGGLRVRLGPRPSAEIGGRPRTSAGTAIYRPVSSIPAGLKPSSKGSKKDRPQEQEDITPESPVKEDPDPFPSSSIQEGDEDKAPEDDVARPHTSSGASQIAVSPSPFKLEFSAMPAPAGQQKQNTMTPEKARLLKAMKLREKKKLMMSAQSQPVQIAPEVEQPPEPASSGLSAGATQGHGSAESRETDQAATEGELHVEEASLALAKADSGIGIDVGADQASVDTHTDSHPTSPMAISDIGDSTQASSISDSTDETVLAAKDASVDGNDNVIRSPSVAANEFVEESSPEPPNDNVEPENSDEQESGTPLEDGDAQQDVVEETEKQEAETVADAIPVAVEAAPVVETSATPSTVNLAGEETTQQQPQIRIPVSKFSTHETKSPTSASSQTIPSIVIPPADVDTGAAVTKRDSPVQDDQTVTEETAETASPKTLRPKSALTLEPIAIGPGHQARDKRMSVASLSDDDRLMDELQSATVQEAKPIVVSKSPISPFFPTEASLKRNTIALDSNSPTPRIVRTVSSPSRGSLMAPADPSPGSARSASSGSAFFQKPSQPASTELKAKSNKLGSTISQRIKALEKLSASTGGPEAIVPKERPSSTFFSVRKTSVREPSRSPSVVERASSMTRKSPTPPGSNESSPETGRVPRRDRTGSMVSRLSMFEGGSLPRGRPESIQVTARIVRDPNQPFPKVFEPKADPGDFSPLDLKQSPLLVDVQNTALTSSPIQSSTPADQEAAVPERKPSLLQRRFSKGRRSQSQDRDADGAKEEDKEATLNLGGRPRRRSSMTVVKDFIKDRRDSIRGAKSPSTDNLSLNISSSHLASPALTTPSRSPSRPPSTHHNTAFPRRLSIGSRRSSIEVKSPVATNTSGSINSALSPSNNAETSPESDTEGKGNGIGRTDSPSSSSGATSPTTSKTSGSRASRFMRRLSNSLGSARKVGPPSISPTVTEEDAAEVEAARVGSSGSKAAAAAAQPPTIIAYMGDVNVQFPDNLLWKRRAMCLDSQGFLILSAVQGTAAATPTAQTGVIKRYHMSDFKPPYTPEIEVQELPNSVVLDFVEGSGLQVACVDRAGQMNVLHILEEAHRSHTNFGQ